MSRKVCFKTQQGRCSFGSRCYYYHPTVPCKYFPQCKKGKYCTYLHIKTSEDIEASLEDEEMRKKMKERSDTRKKEKVKEKEHERDMVGEYIYSILGKQYIVDWIFLRKLLAQSKIPLWPDPKDIKHGCNFHREMGLFRSIHKETKKVIWIGQVQAGHGFSEQWLFTLDDSVDPKKDSGFRLASKPILADFKLPILHPGISSKIYDRMLSALQLICLYGKELQRYIPIFDIVQLIDQYMSYSILETDDYHIPIPLSIVYVQGGLN